MRVSKRILLGLGILLFAGLCLAQVFVLQRRPSAVAAAQWSPSDLIGLTFWVKADDDIFSGYADHQSVGSITNRGKAGKSLFANGTIYYTNSGINGKPGFWVDASNRRFTNTFLNTGLIFSNQASYFLVKKTSSSAQDDLRIGLTDNGRCGILCPWSTVYIVDHPLSGDGRTTGTLNLSNNVPFLFEAIQSNTVLWVNVNNTNHQIDDTRIIDVDFRPTNDIVGFPYSSANATLCEVVVCSNVVSGADLTSLRNYFNTKYALW